MDKPERYFRTVSWHCHTLAKVLNGLDAEGLAYPRNQKWDRGSLRDASDWLELAAELKAVTLSPIWFDASIMMCSSAAEYDDARAKLHAAFAVRITRFSFAWNAFEIVVKALALKPHPANKNSSAKAGTFFIRRKGIGTADYPGYLHLLQHALTNARGHPDFREVVLPPKWDRPYISEAGYGLELCRILRNRLAHGLADLPVPEEWQRSDRLSDKGRLDLINMLVKLLLISVQMILVGQLGPKLEITDDMILYDECGPDLIKHLQRLQLDLPDDHEQREINKEELHA